MNWGKGIILAFVTFVIFIGVLVTVCVRQDISLVSNNYYNEELKYQEQIDRMNNAASLPEKPLMLIRDGQLEVRFSAFAKFDEGELVLTRPSDARYDAKFAIGAGADSVLVFDLSGYPAGRYNTSLRWKMNGMEFLSKESINL